MRLDKYTIVIFAIIALSFLLVNQATSKVYNSTQDGDFNNPQTWGDTSIPHLWDTVNVNHNITWNPSPNTLWKGNINVFNNLTITADKFYYWRTILKVDGKLTINGKIIMSDASQLLINNPDSINITHLQGGYAILTNLSSNCGAVIIDSITTNANTFFNGQGVYLTQFTDIHEDAHYQIDSNIFFQYCNFTYIQEPKRTIKESNLLNFDILGRKIK